MGAEDTTVAKSPVCDEFAAVLPLLSSNALEPGIELTRARHHVDECAWCRRELARYAHVDEALRRHYLTDVLAEPTATAAVLSRWLAGDDEDTPAPLPVGIPTQSPRGRRRRIISELGAVAAVLVFALVAQMLFSGRSRQTGPVLSPSSPAALSPASAMALAGKSVIFGTENGVYALNATDASQLWRYPAAQGAMPDPVNSVVAVDGVVYGTRIANGGGTRGMEGTDQVEVFALRASDGTLLWLRQLATSSSAAVVATGDTLVVAPNDTALSTGASPADCAVFALRASDGSTVWHTSISRPCITGPSVGTGQVYVGTPTHIIALRLSNGAQQWQTPILPGASPQGKTYSAVVGLALTANAGALYAEEKLYRGAGPPNGEILGTQVETDLLAVQTSDGSHIWRGGYQPGDMTTAYPPAVANGVLFAQAGDSLWSMATAADGADGWRYMHATELMGPVLGSGVLFATDYGGIASEQNGHTGEVSYTYAIRASDGHELWRSVTNGGVLAQVPSVADGLVVAPAGEFIYGLRASDGGHVWRFTTPADHITTPALIAAP